MQVARVVGTTISEVKHASLNGLKLLLIQMYLADGKTADGFPLIAMDLFGSRVGDDVLVSSDSDLTRDLRPEGTTPLRWCVMGIQD
ncbi:MAG: EutN/CcmL family microcompartment protein [Planctomycetaceae bacterium]|jgi:ethanolamine utilization protein EutN|nr:EutN/CcmL family microcompartment protein [Planctomycetaceae bacterium]